MKAVRILTISLLLFCLAFVFASCEFGGETTPAGTTGTPKSDEAKIVSFEGFTLEGTTFSLTVPNATDGVSFPSLVAVSEGATWQVSTDREGYQTVPTKSVSLAEGENTFYILVTAEDGETLVLYTVKILRTPLYTVTFETDGGTAVESLKVPGGETIAPPATVPTRAGYEFAGWDNDFTAPITANLTVRARWTPNTDTVYTVEYYLQNKVGTGYERVEAEQKVGTTAQTVTAEQKTFDHFTYSATGSAPSGSIAGDGSLVLKMYYTRNLYTVTFAGNGGTLKSGTSTQKVRYGAAASIPTFTRNGYEFTGWDSTEGCSEVERDLTVTAQWQIVTYTVTYNLDGGTNDASNPATYKITDVVTLAAPVRGEDNFVGWYLPNGQKVERLTGMYGNLTLTARWGVLLDKWETMGEELSTLDAKYRNIKIELSSYGDVEKRSRNDVFLAGPDEIDGSTPIIQKMIYERNAAANLALGTTISYVYWDYGWGQQSPKITTAVQGNAADAPDLFVNMIYDLGLSTLNGCFKDVWTIPDSYFDFSAEGWLTEWMNGLSLTGDRAYTLGSDYFLDIYRSMTVLPFNATLMDDNAAKLAPALFGSALGQNETMSDRFYSYVEAGNWTWDALGKLSAAIWTDTDWDSQTSIGDTLGIIADANSGLCAAVILYTADIPLTETYAKNGQQWIRYPASSTSLGAIFDAVAGVFNGNGALVTNASTTGSTAQSPGVTYHNVKFAEGTLLFAGPRMLGSLDDDVFQTMNDLVSVVPLPKVSTDKEYRTLIHNVADAGAINVNVNPRKAKAMTAYLQYCAENSGEIRNQFLDVYTKYGTFTYSYGTDRMLDVIYAGITDGFDKAVEDLMNNNTVKPKRWHAIIKDHSFRWSSDDLASVYQSAVNEKQARLDSVLETWYTLPKAQIN